MQTPPKLLILLALFLGVCAQAQAEDLFDELFQDHAVLQRDKAISVWGHATAGEIVSLSLGESTVSTEADATGRWSAVLPPLPAGGPHTLTASGSSGSQTINDILIGDVFLCSGQSNMELPVVRASDSGGEISNSAHPTIRMLTVAHAASPTPLLNFRDRVTWQVAGPETVADWSAVCFYFARELQKTVNVPIGLVHSSWGGSNIRPWLSAAALHAIGDYGSALKILSLYSKDQTAAQNQFAGEWEHWWRVKSGDRAGTEPWNTPFPSAAFDAGEWHSAPTGLGDWRDWSSAEFKDFTGLMWFRTKITLTAKQAKSTGTLSLGSINQVDQTWINGKPVGNTFGYGTDRTYALKPGMLRAGDNILVVNILSTYGGGGFRNGGASRTLKLTGGDSFPLDDNWQYRVVPSTIGYPPRSPWESVGGLSTLYNAMIAPLGSYGLRGALWYQGESNTGEPETYRGLLAGMMSDWRRQFGSELPFLIVQLPNFGAPPVTPGESGWAAVREAERQVVLHDPHAGLAVTIDIGDAHNLHPTNKQDVGRRLARVARHAIYGEMIAPSGPEPTTATRGAGGVAVEFADIDRGLVAYSHDSPIGFELCADAAGTCKYAEARIDGAKVWLSASTPASATRVRYCWADSPICTLFDDSGLPVGPFEIVIR